MSIIRNISYSLLDLFTLKRGVARTVNGMKVRFPARWSRYYTAEYEADTYNLLKKTVKPGAHIIDIGAHIGLFSICTSKLAGKDGKIVCFEPTPDTFSILKNTLKINHCDNVTPVQAAVSDKKGTATFYIADIAGCNSNSLVENDLGGTAKSGYEVKMVTIDDVVPEYSLSPDFIKIDAEGAELDVLKGGLKTLKEKKPLLILGLHPEFIKQKGDSLEQIWDLLAGIPYDITMDDKKITREDFCSRDLFFDVHCIAV